jgi:hypothetical protein
MKPCINKKMIYHAMDLIANAEGGLGLMDEDTSFGVRSF